MSHYSETPKWPPPLSARDVVRTAGGAGGGWRGAGSLQQQNRARNRRAAAIRSALNENAFASACVRCGAVTFRRCPYDTLKLATLASGYRQARPISSLILRNV